MTEQDLIKKLSHEHPLWDEIEPEDRSTILDLFRAIAASGVIGHTEPVGRIASDGVEMFEHYDRLPMGARLYLVEPDSFEDRLANACIACDVPDSVYEELCIELKK